MPRTSDQFELVINKKIRVIKILPHSTLFTVDDVLFGDIENTGLPYTRRWRARPRGTEDWSGGQTRQQAVTSCVMSVLKKAGV